jgi:hypothetical protein
MRVRERFGRPFPVAVGQLWARSGLVSGSWRTGAQDRPPGAAIHGTGLIGRYFRRPQACNRIWAEVSGPAVQAPGQVAIRKVNAITGAGCPEAQEASRDRQLPASGIHGTRSHTG